MVLAVLACVAVVGCAVTLVHAQAYSAHTRVQLVAETLSAPREGVVWVGLLMDMDEGWHVYWRNPGDSGLAPQLTWTLPQGVNAGEVRWPYPSRISAGPLTSFGYEKLVLLVVPLTMDVDRTAGPSVSIKVRASWLACQVDCIPGEADLSLVLPLSLPGKDLRVSPEAVLFDQARKAWPVVMPELAADVEASERVWLMRIKAPYLKDSVVTFFPYNGEVLDHAAPQVLSGKDGTYELRLIPSAISRGQPDHLEGVLVNEHGWDQSGQVKAFEVRAPVRGVDQKSSQPPALTFWVACFFAFLGGIILNGMPCVFPVLSIKVLQLVHREPDRKRAIGHAASFSGGIILSFWALALVLAFLKSGGQALGWGFQFQSPVFVFFIAALLFVFALNLFGIFELNFSASASGGTGKGLWASFFSGMFMTVVATPCTAPFMGSALAFALARSVTEGIFIFTFMGLGLALPMVLLTIFPRFTRFVPKPGPWMVTLRHVLAFILMGCVLWLLSVLGIQTGVTAVIRSLAAFLLLALAAWLFGNGRRVSAVAVVVFILIAGMKMMQPQPDSSALVWRAYDPAAVAQARQQGQAVFIDFTAAWCLTCQVNDHIVFRSKPVVEAFKARHVQAFKADWTDRDPVITGALAAFGRQSVPLYVYYAPGREEAEVWPEILTAAMVVKELEQ